MMTILWLKGLLSRRPVHLLGAIVGVGLTVALLAMISAFTVASAAEMTTRAIAAVPVDWQILLSPGTDSKAVVDALGQTTSYSAIQPVGYADSLGFSATTQNTTQNTGAGKVLGISPQYRQDFPAELRSLISASEGVLVAQQTAANLQVTVGDRVTVKRVGLSPVTVTVDGVVDLPNADSLFQAVGVAPGIAPQAPPDNVILLPLTQWHTLFDPQATVRPDSIRSQLHVRLDHKNLPSDPVAAYTTVEQFAKNLEVRLAGSGIVGNTIAARLDGIRADALYARILFLFLGLPGVILAVLLTLAVARTGRDRRRSEQALLRTRGANAGQILQLAAIESLIVSIGGMLLGMGTAVLAIVIIAPAGILVRPATWLWIGSASLVGLILALAAVLYPAWADSRDSTVTDARMIVGGYSRPIWQRIYLDFALLAVSGIVFYQTASTGYQVVLAPEGVPQASVSYETFIAPICLWLGTGLLTLRLGKVLLGAGRTMLSQILQPAIGSLSGIVTASLSRQRVLLAQGIGLTTLAVSFAISTAIFNTTYNAQSRVDAELTNGADIRVMVPAAKGSIPVAVQEALKALHNVSSIEPMQHRFAYVGKDLQDLYGVDPRTIAATTHLANAYFASGNAQKTLAALAAQQDGILVSEETVKDFQLKQGDLLNLRLQTLPNNQYTVIPFHFAGIVREFPTAPKDSFLVANASYIAQQTHNPAAEIVLMQTNGQVSEVARQAAAAVRSIPSVTVTELSTTQRTISSGLTAVDLRGLTRLELSFAVLLLAGATGLILALGMAERQRTFVILTALGAKRSQLGAFLWSEGLLVLISGTLLGVAIGFSVAQMLVKVLTGVFDPPPESLSIPWLYLSILFAAAIISTSTAVLTIQIASRRAGVIGLRN